MRKISLVLDILVLIASISGLVLSHKDNNSEAVAGWFTAMMMSLCCILNDAGTKNTAKK